MKKKFVNEKLSGNTLSVDNKKLLEEFEDLKNRVKDWKNRAEEREKQVHELKQTVCNQQKRVSELEERKKKDIKQFMNIILGWNKLVEDLKSHLQHQQLNNARLDVTMQKLLKQERKDGKKEGEGKTNVSMKEKPMKYFGEQIKVKDLDQKLELEKKKMRDIATELKRARTRIDEFLRVEFRTKSNVREKFVS